MARRNTTTLPRPVPEVAVPKRISLRKFALPMPIVLVALLGLGIVIALVVAPEERNAPVVPPEQQTKTGVGEIVPPADENPPVQTEPEDVAPAISGPTHVNWVKIGESFDESLAPLATLPRRDLIFLDQSEGHPEIWKWLDTINRPDSLQDGLGRGKLFGYFLESGKVIVLASSRQNSERFDLWRADIPFSELTGLPFPIILLEWGKVGDAWNGEQVLAIIPWEEVVRPVNGIEWKDQPNKKFWEWLYTYLNLPDSYLGPGQGTWVGYTVRAEELIVYAYAWSWSGDDPAEYWKTELPLSEIPEGLRP